MSRTYEQLEPVISALDERIKSNLGAFPTDTAEGAIASFSDGADAPVKSLVVGIEPVQDTSSGDPSPENICPISGWTGCNVSATGYNIWDEEWEVGGIKIADGTTVNTGNVIRSKDYSPIIGGASYYLKIAGVVYIFFYGKNKDYIGYVAKNNAVVVAPDNARFFKIQPSSTYGVTYNHDISINYPSTDHDYHPYVGQTIPISWQSEAGTVYGGSLDVLSGVLTVDMTIADMGTLNWMYYPNQQRIVAQANSGKPAGANVGLGGACSVYKVVNTGYTNMPDKSVLIGNNFISNVYSAIVVFDSAYTDAETFKTAVSGQMLVFPIKNPIVYQLTPTEVKSLLGQNNIWANTGDCSVEYRADTKLYIERLTEPDADMIADANITSGSYFMVGNTLYKATANIASGSAVIEGTNATRKSLSEALNEINA